jgi:hypothetical protein
MLCCSPKILLAYNEVSVAAMFGSRLASHPNLQVHPALDLERAADILASCFGEP